MVINNYTEEVITINSNGVNVAIPPGNRTVTEEILSEELVTKLVLEEVDGLKVISEYPSVVIKVL